MMQWQRYSKVLFILLIIYSTVPVYTATAYDSLDVTELTKEQRAQLAVTAAQMEKQNTKIDETTTTDKAKEWIDLGERLALVMTTVASKLGVAADEFLKSTTGQITMWIVLWYLVGKSIIAFATGFVLCTIIIWSFRFFHMTKKVKLGDGKVEYQSRFKFTSHDAEIGSAWAHGIAFFAVVFVTMIIVLH